MQVWNKEAIRCSPTNKGSEEVGHESVSTESEWILWTHSHHSQVRACHPPGEDHHWLSIKNLHSCNILNSGQPDHSIGAEDIFWSAEVNIEYWILNISSKHHFTWTWTTLSQKAASFIGTRSHFIHLLCKGRFWIWYTQISF